MQKRTSEHEGEKGLKIELNRKMIVAIITPIIFIFLFSVVLLFLVKPKNEVQPVYAENNENVISVVEEESKQDELTDVSHLAEKMGEYSVLGELVIDKIEVKQNILDKTEDASLNVAVTHFYGPNVNEVGNLCLTGHNYKDLLKRLNEVEIGDTFYLINRESRTKVSYEVYDKYNCTPKQVECLEQPTDEIREVTLITCNPGGLTRLIVKAKEI